MPFRERKEIQEKLHGSPPRSRDGHSPSRRNRSEWALKEKGTVPKALGIFLILAGLL